MNDVFFRNITNIGDLCLDHIFFEFESEPILFTCTDNANKIYLCVCSEMRHFQKWVLSECSLLNLAAMIDEKIDITTTFLKANELITIISDIHGHEVSQVIRSNEIDPLDLPQSGTFLKYNKDNSRRYLSSKLQSRVFQTLKVTPSLQDLLISYRSENTSISNRPAQQVEFSVCSIGNETFANIESFLKETTDTSLIKCAYQNVYISFETDNSKNCPSNEQIVFAA